ncbi:MAG: DASH family cryptochrome [Myxococcota bacterium]|nr:DASH family cryptochrome [Myxococcota bacterium]
MEKLVIWLTGDSVRLDSNPALEHGIDLATKKNAYLIPLAVAEKHKWEGTQFNIPRSGPHWKRVRANSWLQLRAILRSRGSGLWMLQGTILEALQQIMERWEIDAVVTDLALSVEEEKTLSEIRTLGIEVHEVSVNDLFEREQLPFLTTRPPKTFTQFRRQVEKKKNLNPLPPAPAPSMFPAFLDSPWEDSEDILKAANKSVSSLVEVECIGGEQWAKDLWALYLDQQALSHYKKTRNAFSGQFNSSHLSVSLAHGLISPRRVWYDTLSYEKTVAKNDSTYWLRFELLWREFLHWYARSAGSKLFMSGGPEMKVYQYIDDQSSFERWKYGDTGFAIVDACQKELLASGWMSNRGRQLVASCLVNELNLDWRIGASWFESQLADFDVAVNWGNWAYIAGVGPDPRGGRHFHLEQQTQRYDSSGAHRKHWQHIQIQDHLPFDS